MPSRRLGLVASGLFFLVGVGPVVACSKDASNEQSADQDILNGTKSDRRDVVLLASSSDTQACSGTLIAPDVVATAAHCLGDLEYAYVGYSKPSRDSNARLSAEPEAGTWKRYKIVATAEMPGFVESACPMKGAADVALLRLEEPVLDVTPAEIAEHAPEVGEECLVVGYGRHNADEDATSVEGRTTDWSYNEQRAARVTILSKAPLLVDGGQPYDAGASDADASEDAGQAPDGGAAPPAGSAWFSAKGIDGAHSRGDSGGAIFCGGKLAGVVSCSPDRNQAVLDLIKVYGNLEVAKSFIETTMRAWALPKDDAGAPSDAGGDD